MARIRVADFGLPPRATQRDVVTTDIAALTGPTRAAGELSGAIGREGLRFAEQTLEADAQREVANVKGFINEQRNEMESFVSQNDDFNLYDPEWQARTKLIDQRIEGTGRRAKSRLGNYWKQASPLYQGTVDDWVQGGMMERAGADGLAEIDRIITQDYSTEAELLTADRVAQAGKGAAAVDEIGESEAKLSAIDDIITANVENNVWSRGRARTIRAGAVAGIEKANSLKMTDAIFDELSLLTDKDGQFDYFGALGTLTKMGGLESQERHALESRLANFKKITDEQLEVGREQDRDEINKIKVSGDLAGLTATIEASSLDEIEQGRELQWVQNETRRIAKGEEIVVNEQVRAGINHIATNIYRGTTTLKDAREQLSEARYGDDPTIDDASFRALDQTMTTVMKTGQAHDVSKATTAAIKQITGETVPENLTSSEIIAQFFVRGKVMTEDERRRWGFVNDFENELKDWAGANPDAQHKEFNAFAKDAQTFYKDLAKTTFGPENIVIDIATGATVPSPLPTEAKVREARRKQIEGGTVRVIAPDGTRGTISAGELEQALKEGFTKE